MSFVLEFHPSAIDLDWQNQEVILGTGERIKISGLEYLIYSQVKKRKGLYFSTNGLSNKVV